MELYKKHRPRQFKDLLGQNTKSLEKQIQSGNCPQAILLSGPSGCGKTTIGRILKTKLKCPKADFIEMNAANETGIDGIRKIQSMIHRSTSIGAGNRIWLIDECHRLTGPAQSGLLKMLEDTPKNTYFILATTDPQKLLPTIRTRCTELVVRPLKAKDMTSLIDKISKKEEVSLPDEVHDKIVDLAEGSARKALVLLDSIYLMSDDSEMMESLQKSSEETQAIEIARALLKPDTSWATMARILKATKEESPENVRHLLLGYCNVILLNAPAKADRAFLIIDTFRESIYYTGHAGLSAGCYEIITS